MQPQEIQGMSKNVTNIVLVHGEWDDGSSWSKEIPIIKNAGHKIIAVQLPEHSLAGDVDTVKRAIEHIGGPTILVGHSCGGAVITNAGYNNPNVTGLVYVAAFAPDEGQSLSNLIDITKLPQGFLVFDKQPCSAMDLLKMLPRPKLTSWQLYKNQLINQFLLKNLVHQHGSSSQHGIRCLKAIESSLQMSSVPSQNECHHSVT